MTPYYSFLICNHPTHTDIYYNGMPVGVIVNGHFTIHRFKNLDGTLRPLMIEDLPKPCPFRSNADLQMAIYNTVMAVHIEDRNTPNNHQ